MKTTSSPYPIFLISIISSLCIASCTGARTVDTSRSPQSSPTEGQNQANAPEQPTAESENPQETPEVVEPEQNEITRLNLLDFFHYAETSIDQGRICDFGSPAQHVCTRGGYRTGWGGPTSEEDLSFARVTKRRFTTHFFVEQPQPHHLVVKIRSRARSVEARIGGHHAGTTELNRGQWNVISFEIPEDQLERGDNPIKLRLRGGGRAGASADVDWAWLVPGSPTIGQDTDPQSPVFIEEQGQPPMVLIPNSSTLSYFVRIPQTSRVALTVAGINGQGRLEVSASRDSQEESSELGRYDLEQGESSDISIPLTEYQGDVVRLSLNAIDADIAVRTAEIRQVIDEENSEAQEENGSEDGPSDDGQDSRQTATNLLIILIDTLRADHLTTYNPSTRVQSEFFEAFAERATVFETAQAQENWTKPSVATLLTSLYPSSHNAKSGEAVLPRNVEMLGEILQDRGFVTAAFIANGYVSNRFGFGQGWDSYRNYVREGRRNRADRVIDDSIEWLEQRPTDRPFFLYVHTIDPHVPYCPPSRYRAIYDPNPYRGPLVASRTNHQLGDIKVGRLELNARDRFRLEALYDGEITYHDEHFGRLIAYLEEHGLLENTLIWITSDHGEEFFEHDSVGHGHSLYQELLHVPLVVSFPGAVPAGYRIREDVGLIDVLPTSLELMGLDPHDDAQGQSLVGLLEGEMAHLYQASFSEYLENGRAVRSGDLKLLIQGRNIALYDLAQDPSEQTNQFTERPISAHYMLNLLSMYLGSSERPRSVRRNRPRPVHERVETEIDEETRRQLQALGYILED